MFAPIAHSNGGTADFMSRSRRRQSMKPGFAPHSSALMGKQPTSPSASNLTGSRGKRVRGKSFDSAKFLAPRRRRSEELWQEFNANDVLSGGTAADDTDTTDATKPTTDEHGPTLVSSSSSDSGRTSNSSSRGATSSGMNTALKHNASNSASTTTDSHSGSKSDDESSERDTFTDAGERPKPKRTRRSKRSASPFSKHTSDDASKRGRLHFSHNSHDSNNTDQNHSSINSSSGKQQARRRRSLSAANLADVSTLRARLQSQDRNSASALALVLSGEQNTTSASTSRHDHDDGSPTKDVSSHARKVSRRPSPITHSTGAAASSESDWRNETVRTPRPQRKQALASLASNSTTGRSRRRRLYYTGSRAHSSASEKPETGTQSLGDEQLLNRSPTPHSSQRLRRRSSSIERTSRTTPVPRRRSDGKHSTSSEALLANIKAAALLSASTNAAATGANNNDEGDGTDTSNSLNTASAAVLSAEDVALERARNAKGNSTASRKSYGEETAPPPRRTGHLRRHSIGDVMRKITFRSSSLTNKVSANRRSPDVTADHHSATKSAGDVASSSGGAGAVAADIASSVGGTAVKATRAAVSDDNANDVVESVSAPRKRSGSFINKLRRTSGSGAINPHKELTSPAQLQHSASLPATPIVARNNKNASTTAAAVASGTARTALQTLGDNLVACADQIELCELLGHGGAARVNRGTLFGMSFAVKIWNAEALSKSERVSIEREVQVMRALQHPNIATCFGSVERGEQVLAFMELFSGTLRDVLDDCKKTFAASMSLGEAVHVLHQTASALH